MVMVFRHCLYLPIAQLDYGRQKGVEYFSAALRSELSQAWHVGLADAEQAGEILSHCIEEKDRQQTKAKSYQDQIQAADLAH